MKPQKHGQCCNCLKEDVDLADGFMCDVCCDEHEKDFSGADEDEE